MSDWSIVLGTFLYCVGSAVIPVMHAEAYLITVSSLTSPALSWAIVLAATRTDGGESGDVLGRPGGAKALKRADAPASGSRQGALRRAPRSGKRADLSERVLRPATLLRDRRRRRHAAGASHVAHPLRLPGPVPPLQRGRVCAAAGQELALMSLRAYS